MDTFNSLDDLTACLTSSQSEEHALSSPDVDLPMDSQHSSGYGSPYGYCIIA